MKSGRSSSRSTDHSRSTDSYARFNGPPSIKLTNLYGVLDNSVHDVETETETEAESDFSRESRAPMSHQRKIQRSKSTSPNRHIANQLKQRQKVMFKNFRPEDVDWLQWKSGNHRIENQGNYLTVVSGIYAKMKHFFLVLRGSLWQGLYKRIEQIFFGKGGFQIACSNRDLDKIIIIN